MAEIQTDDDRSPAQDRGHYKIFLGMAAGVGKTYRMLQEGHAEAEAGRDVVIGYLEPHDRHQTIALAEGLEAVSESRVPYREMVLREMDVEEVIARAPDLALIDELAHTNAPGMKHEKRYEDIDEVLAAGIEVFSTVNVQHLESLNDQVAELTGVRVRETFPDAVLGAADEVILIDLTPEALLERLRAGKVYPAERVDAALGGFFKFENLAALRELALRQVAEEVEAKRLVAPQPLGTRDEGLREAAAFQAVGERLLALITPTPRSQRLVRRAWRSAQRLGAELDLLYVQSSTPSEDEADQLRALRRLASVLGAHLLVEDGRDVAETTARVAAERGTTYVLIGRPHQGGGLGRLSEPLPSRLMRLLPGIDLRIVADRNERGNAEEEWR